MAPLFSTETFLHWLLAAGITLLVLDVFFCTEFLSWCSLVIFAAWGTWLLDLPLQWSALCFIGFLALGFAFYYLLWARAVRPLVMNVLLHKAPAEFEDKLAGAAGVILGSGDSLSVRVGDQLFPVSPAARHGLQEGDAVTVSSFTDGFATVKKNAN